MLYLDMLHISSPVIALSHLLLLYPCFQALFVLGLPAPAEDEMIAQLTKIFQMTANDSHTGNPANILHSEREYPSRLKSKKHEDLLPRLDDSVWDQFVKDLGDVSTNTKRDDKSDPHLQIPKSGGKSFDLEIQKDTMCDATKFSVAIIPGQDPTKSWTPVYGKTYGEVAQAMHGASEEDIAKASKALIDTALAMAKPAFGHLSGEKGCTAVLPAPKKRDVPDANLGNTQNSVEKKLEAARYWILLYVDTGLLGYVAGIVALQINVAQTIQAGGYLSTDPPTRAIPRPRKREPESTPTLSSCVSSPSSSHFRRCWARKNLAR